MTFRNIEWGGEKSIKPDDYAEFIVSALRPDTLTWSMWFLEQIS